ncbi:hypothetical protein HDE_05093 [Halotydeus destructor]|nr:hypothetical protein HDE_05093 [Halotydeus destructor]
MISKRTSMDSPVNLVGECIVESKLTRNGQRKYLIKWRGLTSRSNSWVGEDEISDSSLVRKFNASARSRRIQCKLQHVDSTVADDSLMDRSADDRPLSTESTRASSTRKTRTRKASKVSCDIIKTSLISSRQSKRKISKYEMDDDWSLINNPAKTPSSKATSAIKIKPSKVKTEADCDSASLIKFYMSRGESPATKKITTPRRSVDLLARTPQSNTSFSSLLSTPGSSKKKLPKEIICQRNNLLIVRFSDSSVLTVSEGDLLKEFPVEFDSLCEAFKGKPKTPYLRSPSQCSDSSFSA